MANKEHLEQLLRGVEHFNEWRSLQKRRRQRIDRRLDLEGADLRFTDLRGADLGLANLRGALLEGADLRGAIMAFADLEGADLRFADLEGADLRRTLLIGAKITPEQIESIARLSGSHPDAIRLDCVVADSLSIGKSVQFDKTTRDSQFDIYIDRGTAPPELITEILGLISDVHRGMEGTGLRFSGLDVRVLDGVRDV